MANVITIQQFFIGKRFRIPVYQRDYAWHRQQVRELFDDIQEAVENKHSHYLGTIVLARNDDGRYEVVDGQQRISTLVLSLAAFLMQLEDDNRQRLVYWANYISTDGQKLNLDFGLNGEFVQALLNGENVQPETAGQRLLLAAFEFSVERAQRMKQAGGDDAILKWTEAVVGLEIVNFEAPDTGSAIRLFQTVNDRGLPLSTMDKVKSLLIYHSNRYLGGQLDGQIADCFGRCFRAYDSITEAVQAPDLRIDTIAREAFSDNELIRYHYLSYQPPEGLPDLVDTEDYDGYLKTVFDSFLKGNLAGLREDTALLQAFIDDYVSDLAEFCEAFRTLIGIATTEPQVYKLLVVLGLSVRLYPLTIRMTQRRLLLEEISGEGATIADCIEAVDLRVYKSRGTDPGKDIGVLSHRSRFAPAQDTAEALLSFANSFAPDGLFRNWLRQPVYQNRGLVHILLAKEEESRARRLSVDALRELVRDQISREHILSQNPNSSIREMGFEDQEDFDSHKHLLGNLTLLTKSENSRCSHRNPRDKLLEPRLYPNSNYRMTRDLSHKFELGQIQPNKTMVLDRTDELSDWVVKKWPLWA